MAESKDMDGSFSFLNNNEYHFELEGRILYQLQHGFYNPNNPDEKSALEQNAQHIQSVVEGLLRESCLADQAQALQQFEANREQQRYN